MGSVWGVKVLEMMVREGKEVAVKERGREGKVREGWDLGAKGAEVMGCWGSRC